MNFGDLDDYEDLDNIEDLQKIITELDKIKEPSVINKLVYEVEKMFTKYFYQLNETKILNNWLLEEIEKNNSYAMYFLAKLCGIEKQLSNNNKYYEKINCAELYKKSANLDNSYAYYELAQFSMDMEEKIKLLEKSAELNNIKALFSLGCMNSYEYSISGNKKYSDKVIEYFERGINNHDNNDRCRLELSKNYMIGYGVERDIVKGLELIKNLPQLDNDIIEYATDIVDMLINQRKEINEKNKVIAELQEKNKKLEQELDELKLTAPLEGGPEFQKAKARFEENKNKLSKDFNN